MAHSPEHSASGIYCPEDAGNAASRDAHHDCRPPPLLAPSSGSSISDLLLSEPLHMPLPGYLHRCRQPSFDLTLRQDSINWIFKVHTYYRFRPVTAMLSVNYLDRFLSINAFPQQESGWPFQLLSVACLSLAAKMEEPRVPLLLDLQVSEPKFVFEPKTVQRMELFVMASLHWRLYSITAFDYLDYFISKLPSSTVVSMNDLFSRVQSVSSDIILSTTRVIDFLGFPPSVVAAAAVHSAARLCIDYTPEDDRRLVSESYYELLDKEMVRSCHQLIEYYLIDTCPAARHKDRRLQPPAPPSPIGVLDAAACGSCDTRSDNPASTEPPDKRPRSSAPDVQHQ